MTKPHERSRVCKGTVAEDVGADFLPDLHEASRRFELGPQVV